MHSQYRDSSMSLYNTARDLLIDDPQILIDLEHALTDIVVEMVIDNAPAIMADYDAASELYPFWQNYPPDERGRQPIGDQFPWIEVGEHALGTKLSRSVAERFHVNDIGFPSGPDQRWVVDGDLIEKATRGLTRTAWLCIDVKSVGPRDDADHAVMSHNQISGTGEWTDVNDGVYHDVVTASGSRSSHPFYPTLPPLLVLSDGRVAPTVTMVVKPVYSMLPPVAMGSITWSGQPLARVDVATIPNGLLLSRNPNYLRSHLGLLFPGKDDKAKNPLKLRARVSFAHLRRIAAWRHQKVWTRP